MEDNFTLALNSLYEALKSIKCKDCVFDEDCNVRRCTVEEDLCDMISTFKHLNDEYEE